MDRMIVTFPASNRPPKKTCIPCRQRKVRCVGKRSGVAPCDNCKRLRFDCTFRSGNSGDVTKPEPRRASKACNRCRDHKIRCSGSFPCGTCFKKAISCEYPGTAPTPGPLNETVEGGAQAMASKEDNDFQISSDSLSKNNYTVDLMETEMSNAIPDSVDGSITILMESFFEHVYPLPSYSFLHPATTLRRYKEGKLDKSLINAIAAVSSIRSPGSQRFPDLELSWIEESESFIWKHLDSPSVSRLQVILLIILFRAEIGQLRRAFMLAGLAGRTAAAMLLNHERPASTSTSLEVRRRVMWSLKLVERYFSVGLPEFELCPVQNIYIHLPCSENEFNRDADSDDHASYHVCVKLEMFRRDVMKLHRSLALYDQPFPQLPELMGDFQEHLDRIGTQLPDGSDLQLDFLANSRWLPRHLLSRLSWHQCHCDLYRLLLRNFRDAAPRVVIDSLDIELLNDAERLCINHAKAIVQTIASLNNSLEGERLLEFDSAICAYTACRILLFTARFGFYPERPSEEFALSRAEICLVAIRRFFRRSVLVKPIVEELERLIYVFRGNGMMAPDGFSSPKLQNRDLTAGLSEAARIRQRLAVHSLLRQAGFSDEEDEVEESDPALASIPPSIAKTSFRQGPMFEEHNISISEVEQDSLLQDEYSPSTQEDNDSWPLWFLAGEDLFQGEEAEDVALQSGNLNQQSLSFPWLERDEVELLPLSLPL